MNDVFQYRVVDGFWNERMIRRELTRPKLWYGMDFGNDKSETVVCEGRDGKYVVRYDLPVDPLMRSCRDLFDDDFKKKLSEFCWRGSRAPRYATGVRATRSSTESTASRRLRPSRAATSVPSGTR